MPLPETKHEKVTPVTKLKRIMTQLKSGRLDVFVELMEIYRINEKSADQEITELFDDFFSQIITFITDYESDLVPCLRRNRMQRRQVYSHLLPIAGLINHHGFGCRVDPQKALYYFEKSMQQGSAYAVAYAAWIYRQGLLGTPDYQQAAKLYAKIYDVVSINYCVFAYKKATGVDLDLSEILQACQEGIYHCEPKAIYMRAQMYEMGVCGDIKMAKALELYQRGGELEDLPCAIKAVELAQCQYDKKDPLLAFVTGECKREDDYGMRARLCLARSLQLGMGEEVDFARSVILYKEIIEHYGRQGDSPIFLEALYQLGNMYECGRVADPNKPMIDEAKARSYYEAAAAHNHLNAIEKLAIMYRQGRGGAKDVAAATALYKKGGAHCEKRSNLYIPEMILFRARILRQGHGCVKDEAGARRLLADAIALGSAQARGELAYMDELGLGGREPDEKAAYVEYSRAAAQGDTRSFLDTGDMLEEGRGCQRFKAMAQTQYTRAAVNGSGEAFNRLAILALENGQSTQAAHFYCYAICWGNCNALRNYAQMIIDGDCDGVHISQAVNWLKLAITHESSNAMLDLANYYLKKRSYPQAIQYYEMAMDAGNMDAIFNRALMYAGGQGSIADYDKARQLLSQFAEYERGLPGSPHTAQDVIDEINRKIERQSQRANVRVSM